MTESEIEEKADDAMSDLDDQINDWPLDEAIAFMEFMQSNVEFRLRALHEDRQRTR